MWSSRPDRRFILAGLLALPACGFTPVHGPANRANGLFGNVEWQAPTNSVEFDLNEQLRHRLGRADSPKWTLTYSLETNQVRIGGTEANRGRVYGVLAYRLEPVDGDGAGHSGEVQAFTGYTIAETTPTDTAPIVSNRVARQDAERRLAVVLADKLLSDLMVRMGSAA